MNELHTKEGWYTQKEVEDEILRVYSKDLVGVKATTEFWIYLATDEDRTFHEIGTIPSDKNMDLSKYRLQDLKNPTDKGTTFLQNFKNHIALRLTANGSGKTLTLSQAVRDAIHAAEATYGIEAIIVTQKGWTLSPAPGASSQ